MGVFPFQGKTHMVEPGIEPGTSWLVVRKYCFWDFEKRMAYSITDVLFVLRNYGSQITENERGEQFCVRATER